MTAAIIRSKGICNAVLVVQSIGSTRARLDVEICDERVCSEDACFLVEQKDVVSTGTFIQVLVDNRPTLSAISILQVIRFAFSSADEHHICNEFLSMSGYRS